MGHADKYFQMLWDYHGFIKSCAFFYKASTIYVTYEGPTMIRYCDRQMWTEYLLKYHKQLSCNNDNQLQMSLGHLPRTCTLRKSLELFYCIYFQSVAITPKYTLYWIEPTQWLIILGSKFTMSTVNIQYI